MNINRIFLVHAFGSRLMSNHSKDPVGLYVTVGDINRANSRELSTVTTAHTHGATFMRNVLTGLQLESDVIMEIGCLVTDKHLNHLDDGINIIVHQPATVLGRMDEWCKVHHFESGLTEACLDSRVSLEDAESKVLSYMKGHTSPGCCPLAGNTVHEDKRFLRKYMPRIMDHLHYRIVDVSTVKELCRRWYPNEFRESPAKLRAHRSISDIKESIEELRYYWNNVFKNGQQD